LSADADTSHQMLMLMLPDSLSLLIAQLPSLHFIPHIIQYSGMSELLGFKNYIAKAGHALYK